MHKKEHQGAKISAGILKGLVFASAALTFLVLFFLIVSWNSESDTTVICMEIYK